MTMMSYKSKEYINPGRNKKSFPHFPFAKNKFIQLILQANYIATTPKVKKNLVGDPEFFGDGTDSVLPLRLWFFWIQSN
jgi:hypothetical protein